MEDDDTIGVFLESVGGCARASGLDLHAPFRYKPAKRFA
jgi:hypothetical protein